MICFSVYKNEPTDRYKSIYGQNTFCYNWGMYPDPLLKTIPSEQNLHSMAEIGFRFGDKGTHTSRTIMFAELSLVLEACPSEAKKKVYAEAILAHNCLGKRTVSTRKWSGQRLRELYGLNPAIPLFRMLRRHWELEERGRPLLALLTATIDARGRIKLRKLFQSAGIPCKPNEESVKAGEFLARLADLAERAGGDPPLPPRPDTSALYDLRALTGNEQLLAILKQYDTLVQQMKEWEALATLAAERKLAWETLSTLLKHAASLPEAGELNQQARAVQDERRLLEPTDPVPDIRKTAVAIRRKAMTTAHSAFCQMYKE